MPQVEVILCLGGFAFDGVLRALAAAGTPAPSPRPRFAHGAVVSGAGRRPALVGSYHPSQQNTFTGRLTPAMLDELHGAGWSIVSHTLAHDSLPSLTPAELDHDLRTSQQWIIDRGYLGWNVFVAPYHAYGPAERAAVGFDRLAHSRNSRRTASIVCSLTPMLRRYSSGPPQRACKPSRKSPIAVSGTPAACIIAARSIPCGSPTVCSMKSACRATSRFVS